MSDAKPTLNLIHQAKEAIAHGDSLEKFVDDVGGDCREEARASYKVAATVTRTPQKTLDEITREQFQPTQGEDPYCCTETRWAVVNAIRTACGLEKLPRLWGTM